ncbi:MAG: AzlC family ABC transporter permease, partial [Propionibacterium sp.]|nr:AzlC family ABC transporter permease [Propionibacterium sp.]
MSPSSRRTDRSTGPPRGAGSTPSAPRWSRPVRAGWSPRWLPAAIRPPPSRLDSDRRRPRAASARSNACSGLPAPGPTPRPGNRVPRVSRFTPAVRSGLSIAVAVGIYGVSFGALGVAAGLSVAQTCALSLLMFTGGSQFAFVGVIGGGGTGLSALAAATLLGLRNGVYGMQLEALLRPRRPMAPVYAHFTIDESMANATAQSDADEQRRGFWTAGLGVFVAWNLFPLVGAV